MIVTKIPNLWMTHHSVIYHKIGETAWQRFQDGPSMLQVEDALSSFTEDAVEMEIIFKVEKTVKHFVEVTLRL